MPKSSLTKSLPRSHLIHAAASRGMRCSASALARLRFADHTASHLRAAPVKSTLLCSDTFACAPLLVRRRMRARSSHARHAIAERPLTHHSSRAHASHQGIMKTGERKREMSLGFHPSPVTSRHFVRLRNTVSRPPWINGSYRAAAVSRAATTASEPEAHSGREHDLGRPSRMRPTLVGCETFCPLKKVQPESF
jgi:hypothetical protein